MSPARAPRLSISQQPPGHIVQGLVFFPNLMATLEIDRHDWLALNLVGGPERLEAAAPMPADMLEATVEAYETETDENVTWQLEGRRVVTGKVATAYSRPHAIFIEFHFPNLRFTTSCQQHRFLRAEVRGLRTSSTVSIQHRYVAETRYDILVVPPTKV